MKRLVWLMLISAQFAQADEMTDGSLKVDTRIVPIPAGASIELQNAIRDFPLPVFPTSDIVPDSDAEWETMIQESDEPAAGFLGSLVEQFPVDISVDTIAGVGVHRITPPQVARSNADRIFIIVHGGAYVFGSGDAGLGEAVLVASRLAIPVISIDYRMPPTHPFPAAIDDVIAVYSSIIEEHSPRKIVMGGTSAGGGLTLAAVHKMHSLDLPTPGALFAGTAWADLTKTGDTLYSNEGLDRVLVTYEGLLRAVAKLYADGEDLKHPLVSPVYGEFANFPPTMLVAGTRDMLLSDVARTHLKLREAGVAASLHVYDGMSHAGYLLVPDSPESKNVYNELRSFVDLHLDK